MSEAKRIKCMVCYGRCGLSGDLPCHPSEEDLPKVKRLRKEFTKNVNLGFTKKK